MTDEQIINRLNFCARRDVEAGCYECATEPVGWDECREWLMSQALDIINRQKSEIEQLRSRDEEFLTKNYSFDKYYDEHIARAKSEAIKEFAERLKGKAHLHSCRYLGNVYAIQATDIRDIDSLVKEMTEEHENA